MDNTIILYLIKASISLAFFYALYMTLLRKDTFFKLRRGFFLFAMTFSLIFPFLSIEIETKNNSNTPLPAHWISLIEIEELVVTPDKTYDTQINVWFVIAAIIISISTILAIRFLIQLASIIKQRAINTSEKHSSCHIIKLSDKGTSPFSFFNWIFINPEIYKEEEFREIIAHEKIHIEQHHSFDVIFAELICICFWWNPFAWLLKNEMKINLEYLADSGVEKAGFDIKEYQYILLQQTNKNTGIPIINNFNVSQLKKRITMMNKERTSTGKASKYLLAIPLCFTLLLGNAAQASSEITDLIPYELNSNREANNPESPATNTLDDDKPLSKAEVMPAYPGGIDAMMKFVSENLKYPISAQEASIQGRVSIRFVVSKTGEITEANVLRGIDPACDKEALRVVNSMPKWTPGKQNGKTVPVYYNLPITFKLNKKAEASEPNNKIKISVATIAESRPEEKGGDIYLEPEQLPEYTGGKEEMFKFISKNLNYPEEAQKSNIQGVVSIGFIVSKTGEVTEVKIVRGIDDACDAEAIRVIKTMPKWIPGKHAGKNVNTAFVLPIAFKLANTNKPVKK